MSPSLVRGPGASPVQRTTRHAAVCLCGSVQAVLYCSGLSFLESAHTRRIRQRCHLLRLVCEGEGVGVGVGEGVGEGDCEGGGGGGIEGGRHWQCHLT